MGQNNHQVALCFKEDVTHTPFFLSTYEHPGQCDALQLLREFCKRCTIFLHDIFVVFPLCHFADMDFKSGIFFPFLNAMGVELWDRQSGIMSKYDCGPCNLFLRPLNVHGHPIRIGGVE